MNKSLEERIEQTRKLAIAIGGSVAGSLDERRWTGPETSREVAALAETLEAALAIVRGVQGEIANRTARMAVQAASAPEHPRGPRFHEPEHIVALRARHLRGEITDAEFQLTLRTLQAA